MVRIPWHELPIDVHDTVAAQFGPYEARDPDMGSSSTSSALLTLACGARVFVKVQQRRTAGDQVRVPWWHAPDTMDVPWGCIDQLDSEFRVGPYLPVCAPRVLWRSHVGDWHLVGFEGIEGTHANLADDRDVEAALGALSELARRPPLPDSIDLASPVDHVRAWVDVGGPARGLLTGDHLIHGDPASANLLVEPAGRGARLVDWAFPLRGPTWVDGVLWGLRLVCEGGRDPAEAARWVGRLPGWSTAPVEGVRLFARAELARWTALTDDAPVLAPLRDSAKLWADYWESEE